MVSTINPEAISALVSRITGTDQPAYRELVESMGGEFQAACAGKKYFPVSRLREICRQLLQQLRLTPAERLIVYRAGSDAILNVMANITAPQSTELGAALLQFVADLDGRDAVKGLLLRLHYVSGLSAEGIAELAGASAGPEETRQAIQELAAELEQTPAVKNALDSQHLRPKGNVTLLMEGVRDGRVPLADVIADLDVLKSLQRQAAFSIAREGGNISLQASDLLSEFVIRLLHYNPEKAPVNHYEFDALAKQMMHHILVDRARRKDPNRGAGPLPETQSDSSEAADDKLARQQAERAINEEIERLRQADPETVEMVTAVYSRGVDQQEVARLHGVSVSTVKRRIKDFRDRVRQRLGLE